MSIEKIVKYIWFTETRSAHQPQSAHTSYLGTYKNTGYYFIYKKDSFTTLDFGSLAKHIKIKAARYIIYADSCLLSQSFMKLNNIEFKKTPRNSIP